MHRAPTRHAGWPTQGEQVDVNRGNVYLNQATERFLACDDVLCIVGSKGMGKTLLLKFKKRRLVQRRLEQRRLEREQQGDGRLIIPRDRDLDFVTLADGISNELLRLLQGAAMIEGRRVWSKLWECAIALSILNHRVLDRDDSADQAVLAELFRNDPDHPLARLFERDPVAQETPALNPSQFLSRLLTLSHRELADFLRSQRDTLFQYASQITRYAVYVFIDSFDQSLHETFPYDLDIWTNGQLGLLEAAWQMHRQNPHLKIYCSIRQEAYTRYRSENTKASSGNVLVLRYDRRDINMIFETQLRFYDRAASAADLFGLKIIKNSRVGCEEPIQSYIYRHTLGTPRSITIMGRELSMSRLPIEATAEEREGRVREVVNRVSGDEFCNYLQGEMEQFLDFLHDDGNRRLFFLRLPCNILTMRDLERIRDDIAAVKGLDRARVHPFCELFNLGLLGCLKIDALSDGPRVQAFKKHDEFDWMMANILPRQERLFFVHPSAQSTIRALNPGYFTYRGIVVGDGQPWSRVHERKFHEQQIRLFISYCSVEKQAVEAFEAELARALDRQGTPHDIRRDRRCILAGEHIQEGIAKAVQAADYLLVMISEQSLDSGWVNAEWRRKYTSEINEGRVRVIPLILGRLDSARLPDFLQDKHALSLPRELDELSRTCDELARHLVELRNCDPDGVTTFDCERLETARKGWVRGFWNPLAMEPGLTSGL
jgi:hypothetical protein